MLNEDLIEMAFIDQLRGQGFEFHHGPDIAPDSDNPQRKNFDSVVLENELLNNVNILSPEGFRVSSSDPNKSTTNYVNQMFLNPDVISSVDIVATHTYQNIINNSEWTGLRTVSLDKPIWVTEAGNLHSHNFDMADASYHIDRIIDGFNYGGLTAYMFHLFYEQHEYQNEVNQ